MSWFVYNSNGKLLQSLVVSDNAVTNAKMADDAIGVAELSASGTASSSTFLRGDNAWVAPAGGPSQATQSAIKAETNEDTYLPPDLVKHSPGVAKVWCKIHNNGSLFSPDYGISTVGDTGLGDRDVNYTTVFSGVIYAAVGNNLDAGNGHCFLTSHAAADINLQTRDSSSNKQDHAATLVVFGDQ